MSGAVNLVDALGLVFDHRERDLGAGFLREDRAHLDQHDDDSAEATIDHFKRRIWVWVRRRGGKLDHGCDCPHFDETGKGCEHLWALRLLLEPEEIREEDLDDDSLQPLLPRWRLLPSTSLKRNGLVLDLRDPEGRPLALDQEAWIRIEDQDQIRALRELAPAAGGFREARRGGGFVRPRGPFEIPEAAVARVLLAAAATGRLEVADENESRGPLVEALPGGQLEFAADLRVQDGQASLEGRLLAAGEDLALGSVQALVPGAHPWVVTGGRLRPLAARGAGAWARSLRREGSIRLPVDRLESFLREVGRSQPLPLLLRDGRPLPQIAEPPAAELRIQRLARVVSATLVCRYGPVELAPSEAGEVALGPGLTSLILRDKRREQELLELVLACGFEPEVDDPTRLGIDGGELARAVAQLAGSGILVRHDGRRLRPARLGAFRLGSHEDWFQLEASIEIQGEDAAPALASVLAAYRGDQDLVALEDGDLLVFRAEDRRRLAAAAPLAGIGQAQGAAIQLRGEQALLADLVLAGLPEVDRQPLEARKKDLLAALELGELEAPAGFVGDLRPYQKRGLAWLDFVARSGLGGCLADEMGLGKTVQIIAQLLRRREVAASGPALIVAPLSLLPNWISELERFAPTLRVALHAGPGRSVTGLAEVDVAVTSYGTMRRDVERLLAISFSTLVLDEAQAIKNRDSQTAQAARKLRAGSRFALSGTPVENHLEDLWSLFEFLAPELFLPGRSLDAVRRLGQDADPAALARALRPVFLRRRKEEVLDDLPELVEQTIFCSMSEDQELLYGRLLNATRAELGRAAEGQGRPALVLESLLRLRQAACHPALLSRHESGGSGKIELLLDRLEESRIAGRKALVFSQFRSLLDIVATALAERGIEALRLDGRVRDRGAVCARFQDQDEALPLLVSLKVGGTGLNLTAAEEVFILDPWWNPAVEAQAISRAHRIGQQRRVHALRLVSRGTVEEKILRLQERKRALADAIIGEAIDGLSALEPADIAELLS
ncbi:MAG: DEAD/DEAH box helicase [Planctomycetes bacterium]|nr:DEAD/DEAH box helicase [Planctomycetota bacterium]